MKAKAKLTTNSHYAVLITDVVMETDHAGLELVQWVQEQEELTPMRLVIRSGQPGSAPPEEVMQNLSINDYWSKTAHTETVSGLLLTGLVRSP